MQGYRFPKLGICSESENTVRNWRGWRLDREWCQKRGGTSHLFSFLLCWKTFLLIGYFVTRGEITIWSLLCSSDLLEQCGWHIVLLFWASEDQDEREQELQLQEQWGLNLEKQRSLIFRGRWSVERNSFLEAVSIHHVLRISILKIPETRCLKRFSLHNIGRHLQSAGTQGMLGNGPRFASVHCHYQ